MPRGKRAGSKTPTADYDAGCLVRSTSTKCPTRKFRTSSSLQSHAQKMPMLQDPFSGNPQRAWQRRANPVCIALLHLAPESRPQASGGIATDRLDVRTRIGGVESGTILSLPPAAHRPPAQHPHSPSLPLLPPRTVAAHLVLPRRVDLATTMAPAQTDPRGNNHKAEVIVVSDSLRAKTGKRTNGFGVQ